MGSGRFEEEFCVVTVTDRLDSRIREDVAALDGPGFGSPLEWLPVGSKLRRVLDLNPLLFELTVSWLRV